MQVQDKPRTEEQPTEPEWTALALWRKYVPAKLRDLLRLNPKVVDIATPGFFSEPGLVDKTPGLVYFTSATDFAHAVNPKYTKKKHVTKEGVAIEQDPINKEITVGDQTVAYNASGDEKQQHAAMITALNNALELYEGVPQDENDKKTVADYKSAIMHLQANPPGSPGYDNGSKPQSTEMGPGSQDLMHYNKKLQQYNHWIEKMGPESVNAPKIYEQLQSLAEHIGIDPTHLPKSPEELKKDAAESEPLGPPGPTYDQWDKQQQQDKAEDKKKQQSNLVAPEASPAASTGTPTAKGQQIVKGGHNVYYKPEQLRGPGGQWINEGKGDAEKAQMAAKEEASWAWSPGTSLEEKISNVEEYLNDKKQTVATQSPGVPTHSDEQMHNAAAYLESLYQQEEPTEVTEQVAKQKDQQAKDKKKSEKAANKPAPTDQNVAQGATVTTKSGQTGTVTIASTQKPDAYDYSAIDGVINSADTGLIDASEASVVGSVSWYVNQAGGSIGDAYAHAQADLDHVGLKLSQLKAVTSPQGKQDVASKYYDFLTDITQRLFDANEAQVSQVKNLMAGGTNEAEPTQEEKHNAWVAMSTPLSTINNSYPVPDPTPALVSYLADEWKQSYGTDEVSLGYLKQDLKESLGLSASGPYSANANKVHALQQAVLWQVQGMPPQKSVGQQLQDQADLANKATVTPQGADWDKGWQYGSYGARSLQVDATGKVKVYVGGMGGSPQLQVWGMSGTQYISFVEYDDPQKNYTSMLDALFDAQHQVQQGTDQQAYNELEAVIEYFQSHEPTEVGMTYPKGAATPAALANPELSTATSVAPQDNYADVDKNLANPSYHPDDWTDGNGELTSTNKIVWDYVTEPDKQQQIMKSMYDAAIHVSLQLGKDKVADPAEAQKLVGNYQAVYKYMQQKLGETPGAAGAKYTYGPWYKPLEAPKGYKFKKVALLASTKSNMDQYLDDFHGPPAAHYNDVAWVQQWATKQMNQHLSSSPDKAYDGTIGYEAGLARAEVAYLDKKIASGKLTPEQQANAEKFRELFQHAQDWSLAQDTGQAVPTPDPKYFPTFDQWKQYTPSERTEALSTAGLLPDAYSNMTYDSGMMENAFNDLASAKAQPGLVNKTSAVPALTFAKFQMMTFSQKRDWLKKTGMDVDADVLADDYPNWDTELGSMKQVWEDATAKLQQTLGAAATGYTPPAAVDPGPPAKVKNKWEDAYNQARYAYQQITLYGKKVSFEEQKAALTKMNDAKKQLSYSGESKIALANAADELQARIDAPGSWDAGSIDQFKKQLGMIKAVSGITPQKEPQAADYPDYKTYAAAHSKWEKLHMSAATHATMHPKPLPKPKEGAQQVLPGLEDPYLNPKGEVLDAGRFNPKGGAFRNFGGPNQQTLYDAFPDISAHLTGSETSAISGYQDGDYGSINMDLRNKEPGADKYPSVKAMDKAFDRPEAVSPEHILTYRSGDLHDANGDSIWEPGELLEDLGYQSTSNNLSTAQGFSGRVLFAIEIPKGSNVLWVQKALGYGAGGESEILGRRGAKFVRVGDIRIPRSDSGGATWAAKYDYDNVEAAEAGKYTLSKDKYGTPKEGLVIPRVRYLGPNYDPSNPETLRITGMAPPFGIPGYAGPAPEDAPAAVKKLLVPPPGFKPAFGTPGYTANEPRKGPHPGANKYQQTLTGFNKTTISLTNGDDGSDQDEDQDPSAGHDDDTGRDSPYTWKPGDLQKTGIYIDEYRQKPPQPPDGTPTVPQEPPGSPQSDFSGGTGTNILPEPKRQPQGFSERHPFLSSLATFAFNPQESRDWHGKWVEGGIHNAQPPDKSGRYQTSTATMEPSAQSSQSVAPNADTIFGQRTGGALGSNSGGFWTGKDKVERYVKNYEDPVQGYGEVIANKLYRALGLNAPNAQNFDTDRGTAYASDIVAGSSPNMQIGKVGLTKERANKILDGFAADAFLANWDVLGLNNDNVLDVKGQIHRIDNGSAFLHRAQGTRKAPSLLKGLPDWDSLGGGPNSRNDNYKAVWRTAGYTSSNDPKFAERARKQIQDILDLRDKAGGWRSFVTEAEPRLEGDDLEQIVSMLDERSERLVDKMKELGGGDDKEARFTVANFLYNPGQMRGPDGRWVDEGRGYQPHPRVSDPRQAGQQQPPQGGTGQYDVLKQRMLQPGPQKMQAVPRQAGANWRDQAAKLGAGGRLSMYDMQQVHEQAKAQGYNELAQHMEEKQQDPDAKANWFHELTDLAPTVEGLRGNRPPPDQKRKMVNLGLTPSRSKPVAAVEDTEPYYQSTRYKGWLRDVRTEAHRTHVTIHDVTKAAGVWKGKLEPSASIWLSGEPDDLKDFAGSLGGEYNQESVMMFSGDDDDGKSALYSIPELQAKERDQAISLMSQYGLDGGRIVQERNGNFTLEVADEDGSLYNGVLKLGSSLGKDIYGAPGKVSFLSGGTDYPRRSHPHKGAAQTHAYVEARTKAAEEGDDFAA